jgi:anaerobic magnesium-protoporphyrin IX monomethyl ester cyclase
MNGVLFTHSYLYSFDPKQEKTGQPYPPLATIQAAAFVREGGLPVTLFDPALLQNPLDIRAALDKEKPRYLVIYDDSFNYLTKMCLTNMRDAALAMAAEGKKAGCCVIINSSDASDHYALYLGNGIDYVVRGEGEESLVELLNALENGGHTDSIAGLAFRSGEEVIVTPSRPVMRDLDALPMPAWDLVNIEPYRNTWLTHHGYFSLNVATTRGCPFKCNWCAKPIYGNRYNSRSPLHVVEEIAWLMKTYRPDHIWFCDDIFGLKPGWVRQFNSLIKERGLSFRFKIQSRVDLLLEDEVIDNLAAAGAETVWVGAESGSQKILDAMDKGTTVEQIAVATRQLKARNIRVAFFLQFGYLGETRDDIDKTIRMTLDLMPDEIGISVSYPLPGTKFYDKVKGQLKDKQNWSDSDDLAMMFHSTYPPGFYKVLHRYVHNLYRVRRGAVAFSSGQQRGRSIRNFLSMLYNLPVSWINAFRLQQLVHATGRS